jgi:CRP-like cAMP-binding protein
MHTAADLKALEQHPFVARLLQHVDLTQSDLSSLNAVIDGEVSISRRRDLFRKGRLSATSCCATASGRFNVVLPGDIVGIPASFLDRAAYSVTAVTDVTMTVCALDAYVQLCYRRPQFGLALSWIAVQEATTYAEHIIDVGRRTPIERLSHFLLELHARLHAIGRAGKTRFELPFSQEVMADVLGMSLPHLNRMMQRLRAEKMIAGSERQIEFLDPRAIRTLAQYQPQELAPIPLPTSA